MPIVVRYPGAKRLVAVSTNLSPAGKGRNKDPIDHTEDRSVGDNAKGQSENCCQREPGRSTHLAKSKLDIDEQGFDH